MLTKIWDFIEEWWAIILPVAAIIILIMVAIILTDTVYVDGKTGKICGCKVSGEVFVGEDLYVCEKTNHRSSHTVYVKEPPKQ